jgi:hypothetical protein
VPLIAFLSLAFDLAITVCLYVYYTYGDERGGCKRNKTIISLNLVMSVIMIASGVISQASNTRGLLQPSVMSAYVGPPLFLNGDAFVNTARPHTHMRLACQWNDSYKHWWCVRFERSAALLSVWTLLHQCMRCSHSPLCLQTPIALFHSVILCSTLCSTLCSHSPLCLQTPMTPGTLLISRGLLCRRQRTSECCASSRI